MVAMTPAYTLPHSLPLPPHGRLADTPGWITCLRCLDMAADNRTLQTDLLLVITVAS